MILGGSAEVENLTQVFSTMVGNLRDQRGDNLRAMDRLSIMADTGGAAGEVVRCTIVGSDGYDLIARPVAELEKRVGLRVLR